MNAMCTAALDYAARGWAVFPALIENENKKSYKAAEFSGGKPWGATSDPDEIRDDFAKWPAELIGIPTGPEQGFFVVEADTVKGHDVDGIASLRALEAKHGPLPDTLMAESPTGSLHHYFKWPSEGTIRNSTSRIGPGIDARGQGGMVLGPPSIRSGVGVYRWLNQNAIADAPSWLIALATADDGDGPRTPGENPEADPELIYLAMTVIPNDDVSFEEFNRTGMAIWRATGGHPRGLEAFAMWSQKSKKCRSKSRKGRFMERWNHYFDLPPTVIGAGSIIELANKASPGWDREYWREFEKRLFTPNDKATSKRQAEWLAKNSWDKAAPKAKKSKASAKAKDTVGHGGAKQTKAAGESQGLSLHWHGDAPPAPQRWLIRNRLPETGAGLLVGQWGMLKTFAALDLSAHVMMGWDWTGEPVYRKAGVLCLAQEGSGSIPMRLAALVEQKIEPHEGKIKLPFAWASRCPMLLGIDKETPMPSLLATAKEAHERFMKDFCLPLGLIWIDTMSSAGGWTDENDNAQAAQLMNVLRKLSEHSGAVVMGVDHLGKNVDAGSRGASAKEANADFVLALLGNKDLAGSITDMRLALRKMREGPSGLEIPVAPKLVDMGQDEHGYSLTSVVLNWDVKRESKARKSNAHRVLEHALALALKEHGLSVKTAGGLEVRAVDRDCVLAAYKAAYKPGEEVSDGAKRQRFRQALATAGGRIASEIIDGVDCLWFVDEPF